MGMGRLARQLNNCDMVDVLDLSLDNMSISSPSRKLTAEEAFAAEAGKGAGDSADDTESFNEEDCLFGDTHTEEDEAHGSGHYSKALSSAHSRPHSGCPARRAHSLRMGNRDGEITVAVDFRASTQLNSTCLQSNYANVDSEGDDAYKPAFYHSKATAKRNAGMPGPNFASTRLNLMRHEKENENPCDDKYGHSYGDKDFMRLHAEFGYGGEPFASYDGRSSPVDIVPCSSSSSSSPRTTPTRRSRRAKKSIGSVRASLLAEAWERKRELMLNEELANVKDRPKPELLGRSSSDCGKLIEDDAQKTSELRRRSRTRSLTADDFDELRGCIDLGFRFDQSSVPDLCETLPALEVYCAVAQNFPESSPTCVSPVIQSPARCASPSPSASSWKISSPGDDPQDVKGRLKHWAQAVACNARLCY